MTSPSSGWSRCRPIRPARLRSARRQRCRPHPRDRNGDAPLCDRRGGCGPRGRDDAVRTRTRWRRRSTRDDIRGSPARWPVTTRSSSRRARSVAVDASRRAGRSSPRRRRGVGHTSRHEPVGRTRRRRHRSGGVEFLRAEDAELLPYDCEATAEHARRLTEAGLLTEAEYAEVESRLAEMAQNPRDDPRQRRGRALGDRAAARRGRSQGARGAFAQRPGRGGAAALRSRRGGRGARGRSPRSRSSRSRSPRRRADTLMPGYTPQRGQPVTLGHHLLRLGRDARSRSRTLRPCGGGRRCEPARRRRARRLHLGLPAPAGQMRNSIDAVADRDFALDYLYAAAVCSRTSRASARSSCSGRRPSSRVCSAAEVGGDRVVDDTAEAQP